MNFITVYYLRNAVHCNVEYRRTIHRGQLIQDHAYSAPDFGRVTQVPALHSASLQVRFIQGRASTRFFFLIEKE